MKSSSDTEVILQFTEEEVESVTEKDVKHKTHEIDGTTSDIINFG